MKNGTIFIAAGILIPLAVAGYFFYRKYQKANTKEAYAAELIKLGKTASNRTVAEILAVIEQKEFLKAWLDAARKNEPVFIFEGKNYKTQGGTRQ
jgi:predicted negative regulator of RcsB-dependent stress response